MTEDKGQGKGKPGGQPALSCAVCKREIPPDVEQTLEGQEYVTHFCGLDCYRSWHEDREARPKRPGDGGEIEPKG